MLPKGSEKFVAKVVVQGLIHKTEARGVLFNLTPSTAHTAFTDFSSRFPKETFKGVLYVEMLPLKGGLGDEILISLFQDKDFGPMIAIGFGGTLVEELKVHMKPNRSNLFIPACLDLDENRSIIENLPLCRILLGVSRGTKKRIEFEELMGVLKRLQWIAQHFSVFNPDAKYSINELEVNPATVINGKIYALDGVMNVSEIDRSEKNRDLAAAAPKPLYKIKNMLRPKSVIIAGASSRQKTGPGCIITNKVKNSGVVPHDEIYLLHPAEAQIEGCTCYKTLQDVKEKRGGKPVDLLVVAVRASNAAKLCEDAFTLHSAESFLIITAGFAETEGGTEIQHKIEDQLHKLNATPAQRPVICGPNTLGYVSEGSIDTLFTPEYKSSVGAMDLPHFKEYIGTAMIDPVRHSETNKGFRGIAFISQSGAQLITRQSDLAGVLNPGIAVSVGNQMDLSATDFFEYVIDEIETSRKTGEKNECSNVNTVSLYIEGLNMGDGARLVALTKRASALNVIVTVYKAGRTAAGREAAKGHTASMAGDYDMFSFILRAAGAIVCRTFKEMEDILMMCGLMPSIGKLREQKDKPISVGMMSNAGFEKCALADHLFTGNPTSITLPTWTDETNKKIEALFRDSGLNGVVDISAVLDITPALSELRWCDLAEILLQDENCNACIFATVPESINFRVLPKGEGHPEDVLTDNGFLNRMIELKQKYGDKKPFCVSMESGILYGPIKAFLKSNGIPCFDRADEAAGCVESILLALKRELV
ncbi:putative Acetate--CoA ligase [Blattamonas nauphoetae]|uniref:Acetate--CoA ligase n=1 Tax=Blattamonas nauphoetae TaxID=2049346 RepID=A0ABQ9YLW0_9EUKA|nr:putative Acetate--CoA ligase [Blattamonas nauphoetae]